MYGHVPYGSIWKLGKRGSKENEIFICKKSHKKITRCRRTAISYVTSIASVFVTFLLILKFVDVFRYLYHVINGITFKECQGVRVEEMLYAGLALVFYKALYIIIIFKLGIKNKYLCKYDKIERKEASFRSKHIPFASILKLAKTEY